MQLSIFKDSSTEEKGSCLNRQLSYDSTFISICQAFFEICRKNSFLKKYGRFRPAFGKKPRKNTPLRAVCAADGKRPAGNPAAGRLRATERAFVLLLHERFERCLQFRERLFRRVLVFGAHGIVDLQLRLGAAGAHADEAAVLQFIIDGVGLGDVDRLLGAVAQRRTDAE